jgi:diaminohydroxyphosphoribosylaminopyrimidine deaminase / 5-amino-6-(5-phosphoribosylamino)uracil reductase
MIGTNSPSNGTLPSSYQQLSYSVIDRALELAAIGRNITPPNPSVGCVIVGTDGQILGEGHTQQVGGPHAEIMALRAANARGMSTVGATAYVTLEPCVHHGRTGPCCEALISAGIKKVIASLADPNPLVSGRGFERLRAADIEVEIGPGAQQSRDLNIGFFSRMGRKTPWVRMKIAASLDGQTALLNGTSQWITSPEARMDGHLWRARACAILTGIGTVLTDDPQLDVRLVHSVRMPHLVLVDSRLETPLNAKLFATKRVVLIYTAVPNVEKQKALEAQGATVIYCPQENPVAPQKVDLRRMLQDLAQREINEVHAEAGHKLNGSLIRDKLVDELLVYLAPKLIGQGIGMTNLPELSRLDFAPELDFQSINRIGPDLCIRSRFTSQAAF